jgi:hypothetical protein
VCSHLGCQQGDPLGPLWFAVAAAFLLFYPEGAPAGRAVNRGGVREEGSYRE